MWEFLGSADFRIVFVVLVVCAVVGSTVVIGIERG